MVWLIDCLRSSFKESLDKYQEKRTKFFTKKAAGFWSERFTYM